MCRSLFVVCSLPCVVYCLLVGVYVLSVVWCCLLIAVCCASVVVVTCVLVAG